MRRINIAMTMLLAYLMLPGSAQFTENMLHSVSHAYSALEGRSPHAPSDAEHHETCHEDACSGGFHACHCHSSIVFLNAATGVRVPSRPDVPAVFAQHVLLSAEQGVSDSIQRPPRA